MRPTRPRRVRLLGLASLAALAAASPLAGAAGPEAGGKMEDRFKNIQALKGFPAEDLMPTMQFISASLGVDCDFCHVERAMEKDDKDEKKTARKMIQMTLAINKTSFDGQKEVTCNTCHRGAPKPAAIPAVATSDAREEAEPPKPAALPTADALLDRWLKTAGGADALAKVTSRVQTGKLTGFGPQALPVEVVTKAPGKRVSTVTTPRGASITAFDGKDGWTGAAGRPPRPMSAAEADAARLDAEIALPATVRRLFKEFKVAPGAPIEGRETVRVIAKNQGKPPVELWFDVQSGLLSRLVRYEETPLGRNPTQIDYADYRDADAVKIPFRWTLARPGGRFTIQIDETRQNVPVDDAKFEKPAAPAPAR